MEMALAERSKRYAKWSENRDNPNPAKQRALWLREAGFLEADRSVSESSVRCVPRWKREERLMFPGRWFPSSSFATRGF